MPSYLSVILFALTNYRTDGIKPPIRSWKTSLPPQKEKDCHGRMSPTISAPQKKLRAQLPSAAPSLLTLASLCGLLYIPMAASSSKYICFQPHLATFLSPSPHLLIHTSFGKWDQINFLEKCLKFCHILYIWKPEVAFFIFHFMLLNIFP